MLELTSGFGGLYLPNLIGILEYGHHSVSSWLPVQEMLPSKFGQYVRAYPSIILLVRSRQANERPVGYAGEMPC